MAIFIPGIETSEAQASAAARSIEEFLEEPTEALTFANVTKIREAAQKKQTDNL